MRWIIIVAILLLPIWAFGQIGPVGQPGVPGIIMTPSAVCDGATHFAHWTNSLTVYVDIVGAQVINLMSSQNYCGVVNELLTRSSDNTVLLAGLHMDCHGGGPEQNQKQNWAGNTLLLDAGDTLDFMYSCSPNQNGEVVSGQWYVLIQSVNWNYNPYGM